MLFTDSVALGGTRETRDGYLVVDARIARTGIQVYAGREMGRPDLDTVRVYRPESEVFSDRAMSSFAHRPVTNDHPAEMVGATNWRDHAVGMTGDVVTRDGDHVRVPFTLMDADTISLVREGKRELSAGYTANIEWAPGTTPAGEAYDAVMGSITGNHLAIVSRGRAGAACRIGDSWTATPAEKPTMADTTRAVVVDSVSYQMTDQAAQLVEKLTRDLTDAQGKLTSRDGQIAATASTHAAALSAKDGELAAKDSAHASVLAAKDQEIADLKAKLDPASMDAQIELRTAVAGHAKRALGDSFDPKGKSIADMQRAVVTKRLGDAAVAGRDEAFFLAAYDTLVLADAGKAPVDPLAKVIGDGATPPANVNDTRPSYEDRVGSRWKGNK